MLVDFALSGTFGNTDFESANDYQFNGQNACTIWVLLKGGTIGNIQGMDTIKTDENVIFALERFKEGDTVVPEWLGTERQVYSRIYVVGGKHNRNQ